MIKERNVLGWKDDFGGMRRDLGLKRHQVQAERRRQVQKGSLIGMADVVIHVAG